MLSSGSTLMAENAGCFAEKPRSALFLKGLAVLDAYHFHG